MIHDNLEEPLALLIHLFIHRLNPDVSLKKTSIEILRVKQSL